MPVPPPATRFDIELTSDDVDFFATHGYLVIERLTTDDDVAWVNERYDEVLAVRNGSYVDFSGRGDRSVEQFLQPELVLPELMATTAYRNARAVADRLLAQPASFSGGNLFHKPPASAGRTHWHQDESFHEHLDVMLGRPYQASDSLTVWLALQDVTAEMGALEFVPGSHRRGLLPYELVDDDPTHEAFRARRVVDLDSAGVADAVCCPLRAGGATVHSSFTIHGASGNASSTPRRAWTSSFFAQPVPHHLVAGDLQRMAV
jgi:ectoine hydroxylase-related dioxygenase (phytanoyl-CoA dioxygenase family)